jgi:hypothetical protein
MLILLSPEIEFGRLSGRRRAALEQEGICITAGESCDPPDFPKIWRFRTKLNVFLFF